MMTDAWGCHISIRKKWKRLLGEETKDDPDAWAVYMLIRKRTTSSTPEPYVFGEEEIEMPHA